MVEAKEQKEPSTVIMLLGAKADLADKREVIRETVEDFIKEQDIKLHFEVSASIDEDQRQDQSRGIRSLCSPRLSNPSCERRNDKRASRPSHHNRPSAGKASRRSLQQVRQKMLREVTFCNSNAWHEGYGRWKPSTSIRTTMRTVKFN